MAKKKDEATPETPENVDRKPENLTEQASAAPEAVESAPTPPEKLEPVELASPCMDPPLERLEVLADRHRVPTWQQAALARMMGWAAGKQVSEAEYAAALSALTNRRIGGGRVE